MAPPTGTVNIILPFNGGQIHAAGAATDKLYLVDPTYASVKPINLKFNLTYDSAADTYHLATLDGHPVTFATSNGAAVLGHSGQRGTAFKIVEISTGKYTFILNLTEFALAVWEPNHGANIYKAPINYSDECQAWFVESA